MDQQSGLSYIDSDVDIYILYCCRRLDCPIQVHMYLYIDIYIPHNCILDLTSTVDTYTHGYI